MKKDQPNHLLLATSLTAPRQTSNVMHEEMTQEPSPPPQTTAKQKIMGVLVPANVILADRSQQAPNNSYWPPLYYEDYPFRCVDCGASDVWTAEQQWQYFEVWKKNINHRVIRCGSCQGKRKHARQKVTADMREGKTKKHNKRLDDTR